MKRRDLLMIAIVQSYLIMMIRMMINRIKVHLFLHSHVLFPLVLISFLLYSTHTQKKTFFWLYSKQTENASLNSANIITRITLRSSQVKALHSQYTLRIKAMDPIILVVNKKRKYISYQCNANTQPLIHSNNIVILSTV